MGTISPAVCCSAVTTAWRIRSCSSGVKKVSALIILPTPRGSPAAETSPPPPEPPPPPHPPPPPTPPPPPPPTQTPPPPRTPRPRHPLRRNLRENPRLPNLLLVGILIYRPTDFPQSLYLQQRLWLLGWLQQLEREAKQIQALLRRTMK